MYQAYLSIAVYTYRTDGTLAPWLIFSTSTHVVDIILEENMRKDVKGYWQEWLVYLDLC